MSTYGKIFLGLAVDEVMRPIISEKMVEQALFRLEQNGAKPTLDAIRAELGNHGSKTTIVKHLRALKDKKTDSILEQSRMTSKLNTSEVHFNTAPDSSGRSNDFVRLLETINKLGAVTSNPQVIDEITRIFVELKEENMKYQNLLSTLQFFQQQITELLNKSAKT
ncbi:DNA-binding protein [Pseudomonas sp. NFX15]|uniref:DNA-binding protein n=1 Tax=Pseudomonas sp. NFX15 TaxID=2816958 RepID=UPI003B8C2AAB